MESRGFVVQTAKDIAYYYVLDTALLQWIIILIIGLYKTYIRPHLEYAIQAWSPYLQKDIECLESVQRAATRFVSGFKKLYEERLRKVGLTTLEVMRQRGDLIECYKILTGKENIDHTNFPSFR